MNLLRMMTVFGTLILGLGAQTFVQTLPRGFDTVTGGYVHTATTLNAGSSVWQYYYDWTQFQHQCPITLNQISFRRSGDVPLTGTTYPGIQIRVGTSMFNHTAGSATFANNFRPDQVVVYSGPVTIPPYTIPPSGPAVPPPWLVTIPFTTPFSFDPTRQGDFVIEIRNIGGAPPTPSGFTWDGVFPSAFVGQRGHTTNGLATVSNWVNPDAGAVIQIQYSLGAPTMFDLLAFTSGGGAGDLTCLFTNIPPNAVEGYTLISATPASTFTATFGTGPAFGLFPDFVTFSVILTPVSFGSPFHWIFPAGGVAFPDIPIILATGSLTSLSGQIWEVAGVALTPSSTIAGISPPRMLVW